MWLPVEPPLPSGSDLGPLQLAWLGDAVWELHQRLLHCRQATRTASAHQAVVAAVRAEAQVAALQRLETHISRLRSKVRQIPGAEPLPLHARQGVGYAFLAELRIRP